MLRGTPLIAVLAAACGASNSELGAARTSAYGTEYMKVWAACRSVLTDEFHDDGLHVDDPRAGLLETKWKPILTGTEASYPRRFPAGVTPSRVLWHLRVEIQPGGPPWRVVVDGEAALFRSEMSMLEPYRHGAEDEPGWVPERIDRAVAQIHERLKEYAVALPAGTPAAATVPPPPEPKAP